MRHLPRNSRLLHPGGSPFKALPQVTQFDAFLTSDPTEAQITEWVKAICHTLAEVQTNKQTNNIFNLICQILNRPDLEITCNLILTAEIPALIGNLHLVRFPNLAPSSV